jgi:hypothetical protein
VQAALNREHAAAQHDTARYSMAQYQHTVSTAQR